MPCLPARCCWRCSDRTGLLLVEKTVETVPSLMPRMASSASTTIVKVELAPFAKLGFVQVNVGVEPTAGGVQLHPAGTVTDWKRSVPLLNVLRVAFVAGSGPLFVTCTV